MGQLRLADLARRRAGEGALLVAEQLVLEEVLGDRRAVDRDERPLRPRRELVQGAGEQLLAGAALAEQQHGRVARRRALERQHGVLERGVLAEHARQAETLLVVVLEQHELGEQPPPLDRAVEEEQQVVGVDGLREEVGGAVLHRPHGLLDGAERGHHDDRGLGVGLERRVEHVEAAPRRQLQVGEDDEVALAREPAARLVRVGRLVDAVAARLEGLAQHRAKRLLVLDDQDVGQGGREPPYDGGEGIRPSCASSRSWFAAARALRASPRRASDCRSSSRTRASSLARSPDAREP